MTFLLNQPWLLFVAVSVVLFAAAVAGYGLASTTHINEDSHHHEHITSLREGLFILLGLLLGFTVAASSIQSPGAGSLSWSIQILS